jgi:hypothetical protein
MRERTAIQEMKSYLAAIVVVLAAVAFFGCSAESITSTLAMLFIEN